jgi:ABC-type transport system involved in multi-copper enzyme maturation permease subunit
VGLRQVAILTATLLMGRAAVVAANDFSIGTIRPWLISRPSRRSVFAGKLGASITFALAAAVLISLIAYLASGMFGKTPGLSDMAVATAQFALACVALAVFGHAVGVLTRSVPAAVAPARPPHTDTTPAPETRTHPAP